MRDDFMLNVASHFERRFFVEQMDSAIQTYLETTTSVFPFDIIDIAIHDGGDDFLVIEVNGEWMFRFPRQEISRKAFVVEKAFLAKFKSISPLPVPDYRYMGDEFGGYRKIPGMLLSAELFQTLSRASRERIARQLGRFLSAVHNFPLDEAKRLGLTEGWDGWYVEIVQNYRETVAPMFSPSARKNTLLCLDQMLAEPFETRVIHGDFAFEDHVFFDEEKRQLSGMIDFADVTINDPAHDFQNIIEYGGETFFQTVMEHYRIKDDFTLLKRTELRIEARPLFEAAYSLMFGFEERFKERKEYVEGKYG
jgi:aminoglycoside 2''-phosphotransferase